ncbi:head maturation protease, ClpP-related [Fusobacterium animalis]|uniref:head maturation protease, ClpP-related n=1 Tax=Fusobacterium animalis TaxID=76859 RepID=UPI003556E8D4
MEILNQARKNKNELNIQIYGQIGGFSWFDEPVSADQVYKELENFGNDIDTINLYINSPGGSVTEGCAIYSALKRHKAVKNVYIDGQCSSIASVIAMAGDKIAMSPVATMMIHNPITALAGDAIELRKTAAILDIMKETIINAYVTKSHLSREEISALMDTTTYFSVDQAIEKGFATEKIIFDIKNSEFSNLENFKIRPKQVTNSGNTEKKGGESMAKNVQELEAQNKELVENIRKEAIAQERKRINDLDALNEQTQGKCKEIIDAAKESGKSKADIVEDVLAKFIENKGTEEKKVPEAKNPADILNTRREESKQIEIDNRTPGQTDDTKNLIADIVNMANED